MRDALRDSFAMQPAILCKRPSSRQDDDDSQDNLRPARGVIFGVLIGAAMWAAFILAVFPKW